MFGNGGGNGKWEIYSVIASPFETIFKGRLFKIAKGEGLVSPLEMP